MSGGELCPVTLRYHSGTHRFSVTSQYATLSGRDRTLDVGGVTGFIRTSVQFIGRGWGFKPPLVEDDPLTGGCKVWSVGRILSPQKSKNPHSSLNLYKLMCNILSLLLTWYLQVSN